jgi:protein gp37
VSDTTIEWTAVPDGRGGFKKGMSWNPIRGCTHAKTPGCDHCYSETMAGRFDKPGLWGDGLTVIKPSGARRWSGKVVEMPDRLEVPLHWRDPRGVFVNSTSDLFHEKVSFEFIAAVFGVMAACPQHTFMVLTKRPERAVEFFAWFDAQARQLLGLPSLPTIDEARCTIVAETLREQLSEVGHRQHVMTWPLHNVWIGVSVENQECADKRIPLLLKLPAVVRFLSCEPLLGPVELNKWLGSDKVSWTITGGESGRGARPAQTEWFRSIRDQCVAAGTAYFHKQNGEFKHVEPSGAPDDGGDMIRVGKAASGRELDGRTWNEFPEVAR